MSEPQSLTEAATAMDPARAPLWAAASQQPVARGRVSVKRYDPELEELEGENHRDTLEQAGASLARQQRIDAFHAGKSPKIEFQGALLSGRATHHHKDRIKALGGKWVNAAKSWAVLPLEGPSSAITQAELDRLELDGVQIEWIGGPGHQMKTLAALQKIAMGSHSNGERQQGSARQEVRKAEVTEPENPTDSTVNTVESPAPSKAEDPWKGTHWARINLKSFGELLKAGVDDKKLDAAHFKVFLLLVTIMNESNTIDSTQEDMAGRLKLKPSRFSEVVKDLAEMGWIQRFNLRKKNACIRINPNLLIRTRSAHHKKLIEFWEAKNPLR